jgi:thiol:disulfide interchange protein
MRKKAGIIVFIFLLFVAESYAASESPDVIKTETVTISVEQQYGSVRPGGKSALALRFEAKEGWHLYASEETAPGGVNLKIRPAGPDYIIFGEAIFPESHSYFDKTLNLKLEVYSGEFTVYVPFTVAETSSGQQEATVEVGIEGAVCSGIQCRVPRFGKISTLVKISSGATMEKAAFLVPVSVSTKGPVVSDDLVSYSVLTALLLAFVAGLSLNIMPCVWPVLPLIVMRIIEQSKESKGRSVAMGLVFCVGILLFFACLAGANIVLQVVYGTVLQWGDQFRNPGFVAGMALLLVVLSLFMFGVFTITVPSSIASKSGTGRGFTGALGMGFLAAVLSTPCSFAILAAAFAWAQAQPLVLASLAIMVIGVGMAVPYAILTSMPGLLSRLPRGGRWMELFKQAIGFVLLVIAVKLIGALPEARLMSVLYFSVVLGFCVWMWGSWVSYGMKVSRKIVIRFIAVALAVLAGWSFLRAPAGPAIAWEHYDAELIEEAKGQERPVLIKFTADWCLSCQAAEKMVFSREDIVELIAEKGVLAVKADTTTKDLPATKALRDIYNEPGVPVSILFVPGEKESIRWRGISFADELKSYLEKLPSKN